MKATVKEDARWKTITACAGTLFIKGRWDPVPEGREEEAMNNPFLDIDLEVPENDVEPMKIDATESAIELALANDIDLGGVAGTGKDGKITLADVRKIVASLEVEP